MPTRRSSRHRNAAFEAPAAGATAFLSTPDPATVETSSNARSSSNADSVSTESASTDSAIALAAAAPLSRRAARERRAADVVIETPDEPFIAAASEQIIADVPAAPVDVVVEVADPTVTSAAATSHAAEPVVSARDAESALPVDDEGDAFERASRAFRTTGAVPTVATERPASVTPEQDAPTEGILSAHVASGRPRRLRKAVTLGATVGVMGIAGLLAVGMTLPAEAVAAVQGAKAAATSLVSASAAEKSGMSSDEIQAFVAPAGVENESLARADDFSTVSLVQVAEEQGINYSGEVFTNDPDAAIQWPFLVGVGMSYGYGMRSGRLHEGIDFVPGNGAPIQAIADGTVRIATEQGGAYGVTVYIDHVIDGAVITSHYSHMQYGSLQVKAGDTVKVGTIVGKTGNTGRSYGAHLHFELIVNGSTIDPLPWLRENAGRTSY